MSLPMEAASNRADRTDAADIILVGAGHAHLQIATRARRFRAHGLKLAIIDPGDFWYSGMASGLLGGRYDAEEDRIDVERFARRFGVIHRRAKVIGLDREKRRLSLSDGESSSYRAVSFNIGSEVDVPFPVEEHDGLWRAKPIHRLAVLRDRLLEDWRTGRKMRFLVVGGGPTGCELACNVVALANTVGARPELTLLEGGPRLMPRDQPAVSAAMLHFLVKNNVAVRLETPIARVAPGRALLASGETLGFDHALLATGLIANSDVTTLGLRANRARGLVVDSGLRSVDDPHVFAAGDCADILGHDLPRLGVFGVRAAPILMDNLLAPFSRSETRHYRPQKIWFSAQNLGDGTGLASWGPLWWQGRSALWAKEWLDRRFMKRFRRADGP